jgi:HAMP domain-containing protein
MSGILPHTVRGRFIFLIVLAFIPSLALFWYANRELTALSEQSVEHELLRLAESTGVDFGHMVEEARAMLFALAQNDEVLERKRPECDELLGRMLAASPRYTALAVIDAEGYRSCGAVSLENPLYLGDRSYVVRATGNRDFAVGDYQVGRITGKPTVGMAYPMYGEGDELLGVLGVTLDLTLLGESASEAHLPADASFTLSDLSGNVLVRYPEGADLVGTALPETFPSRSQVDQTEARVIRGEDLDGVERRFAVAPLLRPKGRPVGYLAVAISEASVTAQLRRILGTELSLLAGAAVVMLLAAWSLGHYTILNRTSAIIEAERRIAGGDYSARTGIDYGDDELGSLARTFDEMAEKLEERDHAEMT